jgi:excisionase family DNA binding protein
VIEPIKDDPGLKDVRLRTVSPTWLAHFWNVHLNTVYRDIRKGALKAYRLPGGQLRVTMADARKYGRPID